MDLSGTRALFIKQVVAEVEGGGEQGSFHTYGAEIWPGSWDFVGLNAEI